MKFMEMDHDVRTHAAVLVNFHESCTFFFVSVELQSQVIILWMSVIPFMYK